MQQHAARVDREHDMRRLWLAVGIGDRPRLDGVEPIGAVGVGAAAAKAPERRIGQGALVLRIGKAALRIGLPYLEHAIRHRLTVAVEHPPSDPDAIA